MALVYAHETALSVDDYVSVLAATTMRTRRPLANLARIRAMLEGANFVVTARDETGAVVGLARCITDGAWVCYCAELAVRESYQGQGVGQRLLDTCSHLLGPAIGLILVSEPEAEGFYARIGMTRYSAFFRQRGDAS
jgi:GNAT superfamily N-acetyltransferase